MKSNQERSNGCLPPKKREILALEQRPVVAAAVAPVAPVPDILHTENLAWLASVASERCRSTETSSPRFPVVSSSSSSSISSSSSSSVTTALSTVPLTSLPAIYSQQGGAIQYAQLAPNVQFISSAALAGPYAGYISSQILPTSAGATGPTGPRPQLDAYTAVVSQGNKVEQHQQQHFQIGLSPDSLAVSLPSSAHITGHQYIHLEGAPLTVSAPSSSGGHHHQLPLQLHPHHHHPHPTATVLPHHTLTLGPSQLLVQYSDAKRAGHEGVGKGLANGESELGKSAAAKAGSGHALIGQQHQHHQGYEARHILLPADYCQDGLQTTSLVLVAGPQPPGELDAGANKGGGGVRRPVSRSSAFSSSSSSSSSSSAAIQTTTHAGDELLYSSAQTTPIIGYIAASAAGHHHHQHAVSYHATLPQHLVIPGGQSLLIPVSGGGGSEPPRSVGVATSATAAATHLTTAMPHAYLATALAKCELLGSSPSSDAHRPSPAATAVVQAIVPGNATAATASPAPPVPASPPPPPPLCSSSVASSSPASLPPFFTRGSIIQLADGELKRVEDLRTEDFIRSAEISSELKIDSSTVERIDRGPAPDAVLIQFAVGELKAQVCVEVLVEYPFFVFGQGWSSCSPDRTTRLFELSCAKLCVGDVCVSLTLRGLRNGSVRVGGAGGGGGQGLEVKLRGGVAGADGPTGQSADAVHAAGSNGRPSMRKTAPAGGVAEDARGPAEEAAAACETRDPRRTQSADADRPPVRKRRWSAPERDQTDKAAAEEEPPATLPKPSFIPHEVKVSIEGRSSVGS